MYRVFGVHPSPLALYRLAVLVGCTIAACLLYRRGGNRAFLILPLALVVGGFGGRFWALMFYPPRHDVWSALRGAVDVLSPQHASVVGAFLGGFAVVLLGTRMLSLEIVSVLSAFAPAMIVGQAIARLSCHYGGCCFGEPTTLLWGVVYPMNSPAGFSMGPLPLHPVALYEAILLLALFALYLILLWRRGPSCAVAAYFICHPVIRFGLEFIRADSHTAAGGVTSVL